MKQASPATSSVGHHSPRLATEPPSTGRSRSPHLAGVGAGASASASASGTSILDTGSVGAPATDTVSHGAAHDQRQAGKQERERGEQRGGQGAERARDAGVHDARMDDLAIQAHRSCPGAGRSGDRLPLGRRGRRRSDGASPRRRSAASSALPPGGRRLLGLADQRGAVRVLFRVRAQLLERPAVGALAESAQRFPVGAALDDLFAHIRACDRCARERRRCQQRGQKGYSALEAGNSHRLTNQRYQRLRERPSEDSAREKPSAHASWLYARTSFAPVAPSRVRSGASRAKRVMASASARGSPAGTISPLCPSRTRPPAAAPTASVAITASPLFIASFTTNPHGSRKVRVAIEGTTSTSLAAYTSRSSSRPIAPRQTIVEAPAPPPSRGTDCVSTPASTSAASGGASAAPRQAAVSTASPFSGAGRPTNRNLTSGSVGHELILGGAMSGALQKSLSTDCGAMCTLRAPRALT